jgi:hypothetical protein
MLRPHLVEGNDPTPRTMGRRGGNSGNKGKEEKI